VTLDVAALARAPNALAPSYARFRVQERTLLTGHSHQAWPDVAFDGQLEAAEDAARHVDEKWSRAFERAERVRDGFRRLLAEPAAEIALGASTHELLVRLLSALPWRERRRIVSTDGEFHTLRRQLARLEEEGVEVARVGARDAETLAERLGAQLDDRTLAVLVSAVLFESARIVPGLDRLAAACERRGVPLVVDVYHALGAIPFRTAEQGLGSAFLVGGGYKYLQLGEGNAFLRLPPGAAPRPVLTGWYAEFAALAERSDPGRVAYGSGAAALAGATYDPTSHYRAARVFDFFVERGLDDRLLRAVSRHQVGRLAAGFDALGLDPRLVDRDRATALERVGGFLALEAPRAAELERELLRRGVHCDHRGARLRLGPAPYLADAQLDAALAALADAARTLA
jgi:kynureninase